MVTPALPLRTVKQSPVLSATVLPALSVQMRLLAAVLCSAASCVCRALSSAACAAECAVASAWLSTADDQLSTKLCDSSGSCRLPASAAKAGAVPASSISVSSNEISRLIFKGQTSFAGCQAFLFFAARASASSWLSAM